MNYSGPLDQGGFLLTLSVEISAVEEGRQALLTYLAPFSLDERIVNRVEVVLEELVSNVVRHSRIADKITIAAKCADGGLRLTLEDNGEAFNPLEQSEPASFTSLDEAQIGGQGILLIKRLSKSVTYQRAVSHNRISVDFSV